MPSDGNFYGSPRISKCFDMNCSPKLCSSTIYATTLKRRRCNRLHSNSPKTNTKRQMAAEFKAGLVNKAITEPIITCSTRIL